MVAGRLPAYNDGHVEAPLILGLQPAALIDHVARVDQSLLDRIPGEHGGSITVIFEFLSFVFAFVDFGVKLECF